MLLKTPLGAQVWALRNVLQNNAEAVFEKLAIAGFSGIEPAGFDINEGTMQGFKPAELKQMAGYEGLQVISGHFHFEVEDASAVCGCAAEMGMKYVVRSFLKNEFVQSLDQYKAAADTLNDIGETAKMYGLQLAYHNHAHELVPIDGLLPFDILLEKTDPELVSFQADLGWMAYAGQLPQEYFKKHPGRFSLWHLRDIDAETQKSTTIGTGMVDFKSACAESAVAGLKYAFVEMGSDTLDPLTKIIDSYAAIQRGCSN